MREIIRLLENPYLDFSDCADLNDVTVRIDRRIRALLREAESEDQWAREAVRRLRSLDPGSPEYRGCAAAVRSRMSKIESAAEARHAEMFALFSMRVRISGSPRIDPVRWAN